MYKYSCDVNKWVILYEFYECFVVVLFLNWVGIVLLNYLVEILLNVWKFVVYKYYLCNWFNIVFSILKLVWIKSYCYNNNFYYI